MPAPKKPRKSKSAPSKNQYTAELSSSQLVLGMTILLVFGLACFLFGVLIGKIDPSLSNSNRVAGTENASPETASSAVSTTNTEQSEAGPTATNQSSAPSVEERNVSIVRKPVTKPTIASTQAPTSTDIGVSELQPTAHGKVNIPDKTPQAAVAQPAAATVSNPATQPNKPMSPTAPVTKTWGIQIAAFKSDANAATERTKLELKLPYKIDIVKRKGDVWNHLVIGNYLTKSEANTLKKELIEKYRLVGPHAVSRN